MKVLLAAINAKYIHSNLGIYSLKTYGEKMLKEWGLAEEAKVSLAEYTINHQMEQILQDIYKRKPDVIGFSCYIWNISYVKMILADIKKSAPGCKNMGRRPGSFLSWGSLFERRTGSGPCYDGGRRDHLRPFSKGTP